MPPKQQQERVLTPEEAEAVTQRLFYSEMEKAQAMEVKRMKTLERGMYKSEPLSNEQCEGMIDRNYTQALDKKRRALEKELKAEEAKNVSTKVMSAEEIDDMVQRMYYGQKERAEIKTQQLARKYLPSRQSCRLTKEAQQQCGIRLSSDYLEQRKKARAAIFEKYIAPLDPPRKTITTEQLKAMSERLCPT